MDLFPEKNRPGDYQVIKQLGLDNVEYYFYGVLPCDIEIKLDDWLTKGFEVGIFDIKRKVVIYKSENFKGHADYATIHP